MSVAPKATVKDYFIGATVGGYRISAKLGEGAMGVVYKGEHQVLGRPVAIKFLSSDVAQESELVSRFFTEARAVNGIRHPNIVDITDFGQRGNRYYYVMELLEGKTLMERLAIVEWLDTETSIRIGTQVAAALASAHDKGIVHRDLKPDNIFVCNHPDYPDYVKIFDFGIAKLIQKAPTDTHKTQVGYVLGTPLYMSPEQCVGEESLDHRSDVYSLGVVLYRMVAGAVPFDFPNLTEIISAHLNTTPTPPSEFNVDVHPGLEAVILKALSKNPEDRYQDMREMRDALLACQGQSAVAVGTPPPEQEELSAEEEEANSGRIVEELIGIILERIETDRLVLPAMPEAAMKALKELKRPNVTFHAVAQIIGDDPVLAPQLFRKASSAAQGNAAPPRTIDQAISRLGMSQLQTVLIELSAHQVYESKNRKIRRAFKGIWEHSQAVAAGCRLVAQQLGLDPQLGHMAGLMHDVGKPVVGSLLLEAEKMLGMKKKDWLGGATWIAVVNQSHRNVGMSLATKWEMPEEIIDAISGSPGYQGEDFPYRNLVHFVNAFAKRCGKNCGPFDDEEVEDIVSEGVDVLGLDWIFVHDELAETIRKCGEDEATAKANQTQDLRAR